MQRKQDGTGFVPIGNSAPDLSGVQVQALGDLENNLLKDIKKTGFPLELRVANTLLKHGYFVDHNLYYVDKDEQKGREIELSALKNSQSSPRERAPQWVRNMLLIECKKARSGKPWVIFTSPTTNYDSYIKTITQNGLSNSDSIEADTIASVTSHHPYWLRPRRGRSHYEAFSSKHNDRDAIHEAMMSVVKATIDKMEDHRSQGGDVWFYHPVIVVDGPLWDAHLDPDNNVIVHQMGWIPVSFAYRSPQYEHHRFTVIVVKESHFLELLKALDDTLSAWALLFDARPQLVAPVSR